MKDIKDIKVGDKAYICKSREGSCYVSTQDYKFVETTIVDIDTENKSLTIEDGKVFELWGYEPPCCFIYNASDQWQLFLSMDDYKLLLNYRKVLFDCRTMIAGISYERLCKIKAIIDEDIKSHAQR